MSIISSNSIRENKDFKMKNKRRKKYNLPKNNNLKSWNQGTVVWKIYKNVWDLEWRKFLMRYEDSADFCHNLSGVFRLANLPCVMFSVLEFMWSLSVWIPLLWISKEFEVSKAENSNTKKNLKNPKAKNINLDNPKSLNSWK